MAVLLVLCAPVALLADEVASAPLQYALLPVFLVVFLSPSAYWLSKVARKNLEATHQAMVGLQEQLEEAVRGAEDQAARREVQVQRQQFETHLANALEMADGESEVVDVVRHALEATLPDSPVEMLLADNSHAHLSRVVAASPTDEPPGCGVDSPDRCPAARRRAGAAVPRQRRSRCMPQAARSSSRALLGSVRARVDHGSHRRRDPCHGRTR